MSSHHIIREHQEPALYVHDWKDEYAEVLGQLCEWSPKIYTNRITDPILRSLGIKVDELLEGDDLITTACLLRESIEHVNVLCESVELITSLKVEALVFVNEKERSFYRADSHSKWYAEGQTFFVRAIDTDWVRLKGTGGLYEIQSVCWVKELVNF